VTKTHSKQDVYLGDEVAYTGATVVEGDRGHTLRVRVPRHGKPGVWDWVIHLTETTGPERRESETGTARTWVGLNDEGASITVTAIPRKGCVPCGRR
jgi:hypothetical protein